MTTSIEQVANAEFDYVVLGGGTTGLTLAARLTEDATKNVLVLEAGDENLDVVDIMRPLAHSRLFTNPDFTWQHRVIKQQFVHDREGMLWQRGRGLGGSSGVNIMIWSKPPARDIDDIERLGNPGWNWSNYEAAVARTEGFVDPPQEVQENRRMKVDTWKIGREGPLTLSYPPTYCPAELKIQESFINAGMPIAPQPLSGDPNGSHLTPCTYDPKTHTRTYATTAYYLPNRHRKNFNVLVRATVRRVLFGVTALGEDLVASSVEFEHEGKIFVVHAKKEVVLCTGAIRSPHILEQSGIGRQDVLEKAGISIRYNLPGVGENVQEHLLTRIAFELKDEVDYDTIDVLRDPALFAEQLKLYEKGHGVFTSGISAVNFTTLDNISSQAEQMYHNMREMVANLEEKSATDPVSRGLLDQWKINLERFQPGSGSPGCEWIIVPGLTTFAVPPEPGKRYVGFTMGLNHCFSRGKIHSISNDPLQEPEIDARYGEQSCDLEVFLEMFKFARKVASTAPMKDMIVKEHTPGSNVQTDDDIRKWLNDSFGTSWHTVGSCSMLPKEKGGVVDPTLKVYGTKNLRIADLSVIPLHFAAHSQATAYSVAELAADIIRNDKL